MDALGRGSQAVLGGYGSLWRRPRTALPLVMGNEPLPDDPIAQWEWFRNPVPPASEGIDYRILRQALRVPESEAVVPGSHFERLRPPDRARLQRIFPELVTSANPFIRHIVLRNRTTWKRPTIRKRASLTSNRYA
jgi:hypothetical protein